MVTTFTILKQSITIITNEFEGFKQIIWHRTAIYHSSLIYWNFLFDLFFRIQSIAKRMLSVRWIFDYPLSINPTQKNLNQQESQSLSLFFNVSKEDILMKEIERNIANEYRWHCNQSTVGSIFSFHFWMFTQIVQHALCAIHCKYMHTTQ